MTNDELIQTVMNTRAALDKAEGRLNQVKLANSFLYRERDAARAEADRLAARVRELEAACWGALQYITYTARLGNSDVAQQLRAALGGQDSGEQDHE